MSNDWTEVRYDLDVSSNFVAIANSPWYSDAEYDSFSAEEFARRHSLARSMMEREGLDALLLTGGTNIYSMGAGVTWGSGLIDDRGMCQYLVIPRVGEPTLFYPHAGCHIEAARRQVRLEDVRGAPGGNFGKAVGALLVDLGIGAGVLGVTVADTRGPEYMGAMARDELMAEAPGVEIRYLPHLFHEMTYRKSPEELAAMAKAGSLAVAALAAVHETARPGVKEHQLAAAATGAILDGGGRVALMMIGSTSMTAPQIVFPNPNPSQRALKDGDVILAEISASYLGYSAKVGHPITLGEPTEYVADFFSRVVVGGFAGIQAELRSGNPLTAVQEAGSFFRAEQAQSRPILLHGIDLITANPFVTVDGIRHNEFDATLQPGMVVNIEITPINADGTFGMFLSRTFAITESGHRPLTEFPLDDILVAG